jgi:hypothetical protein
MMRPVVSRKGENTGRVGRGDLTVVAGIVIPVEWDEEGNVLATIISSPGEEEYLVEADPKGKELLGLVRQEIEVSGIVRKGVKGGNTIRVNSYRLKKPGEWQE